MKRLISILLAFLVLGTNLGFSFGVHYCGGRIAEAKIFISQQSLGCGMEVELQSCDSPESLSFSKKSCCQDKIESLVLDEDTIIKSESIQTFAGSIQDVCNKLLDLDYTFVKYPISTTKFLRRTFDFNILFQSFLI